MKKKTQDPDKKIKTLKIECKKLEDLKPHPRNPRLHPEKGTPEWETLRASLEADYFDPIVWNQRNGMLVSGHLRTKVMIEDGVVGADVVVVDYDEPTHLARMIAANKSIGENDLPILKDLLQELDTGSLEMNLTGYCETELEELMTANIPEFEGGNDGRDAEPQLDRASDLNKKWKVASGEIWKLGDHRLLCGDCTDFECMSRLLNGEKIDLVFTSPPYNQGGSSGDLFSHGKRVEKLYLHSEDSMSKEQYEDLIIGFLNCVHPNLSDPHAVVVNISYNAKSRDDYGKIIFGNKNPLSVKETIAWHKGGSINLPQIGIYSRICEFVFVMSSGDKYLTSQKYGDCRWNFWQTKRIDQTPDHKATFSVELPCRAISEFSNENQNVLDPFLGSGTTMVACENLKRKCMGIEISPQYCAVILQRMSDAFPGIEIEKIE